MPKKSLRHLDLNLMVVFEAVYASGNISQASKHLALSQPAVSNALARLRMLMDDPLFVRSKTGVAATPKARRMIGPVRDALKLLGAQIDLGETDFATYERHFRIVISDPMEAVMMPAVVNALAAKMPKVTLECLSGFRADFVHEPIEAVLWRKRHRPYAGRSIQSYLYYPAGRLSPLALEDVRIANSTVIVRWQRWVMLAKQVGDDGSMSRDRYALAWPSPSN